MPVVLKRHTEKELEGVLGRARDEQPVPAPLWIRVTKDVEATVLCPQGSRHPSALWAGDGRTRAIRRFFPKAGGGFAAQDSHCQAGALRRAATVRVPLDGVRWTEAPRGRPCLRQGARAGARTAPPRRAPKDPGRSGGLARIAAAGVRLPTVPPRDRRAVPASPGGPPGSLSPPSAPPWPYRSRNLSEFPVSPHLGREPSSRRSSAPGRRRPVVQQPTVAEGPTPRHPLLRPVSQRLEAKGARAARSQRGGRGASERRTKGSQEGRSLQPHRGPFARPSPESPAGGRTHLPRSRRAHLASRPVAATQRGGRLTRLPAPRPSFCARDPHARLARRTGGARDLPAGLPGRALSAPCPSSSAAAASPAPARLPRPGAESPTLPGARLNPGRRCPTARVTPLNAVPGVLVARGKTFQDPYSTQVAWDR
ncbi:serine/arginine repetitive matrix protein 1-like [Mustela lutreola]|uniref:serine/arginine repetitive matrix protein 1-like n=1 Tax=Mustela lutreola TaxID=9666 RepID=UPI002796F802|nr:serine/arginine repetitive matrix protein 1-like [Mustela lutreola]